MKTKNLSFIFLRKRETLAIPDFPNKIKSKFENTKNQRLKIILKLD